MLLLLTVFLFGNPEQANARGGLSKPHLDVKVHPEEQKLLDEAGSLLVQANCLFMVAVDLADSISADGSYDEANNKVEEARKALGEAIDLTNKAAITLYTKTKFFTADDIPEEMYDRAWEIFLRFTELESEDQIQNFEDFYAYYLGYLKLAQGRANDLSFNNDQSLVQKAQMMQSAADIARTNSLVAESIAVLTMSITLE